MEENSIDMKKKRIEQTLSEIGAKIAGATDLSRQANEMMLCAQAILINAQRQVEALYISLENNDTAQKGQNLTP